MSRAAEIVARLTLNGEKFSAETARIFGSLETAAKEAGQQVEGQLAGRLEKIKEIASRGVSIDIQGLKESAAGAAATASSLKTVADAAERVAAKAGGLDTALNAQATAARNAAAASEMRAAKLVEEARAMDLLQAELGQATVAHGRLQAATRGTGGNLGMAGQQVQDFAIQIQNGQNPIAAFSQQMSQMGFALQGTGGWLGKVGDVLNGPWGAALVLGGLVAASFSDKIFGATDEVKKQVKALEEQEKKTRDSARAQEAFGKTGEGAAASIRKVSDELDRQNRSLGDNIALTRQKLRNDLATVRQQVSKDERDLLVAREDLRVARASIPVSGDGASIGAAEAAKAAQRVKELEDRIAKLRSSVSAGERALRQVDLPLIDRRIEEGMTAEGRAAGKLREELERLRRERSAGTISSADYERQSRAAREANAAELERLRKTRSTRSSRAENDATSFINPVGGGRVSGAWNEQRTGRRHAGIDLAVPVGTAVKAAAGGVIIETGNDPGGYGNFVIIDHGRGTTTRYAHLLSIGKQKGAAVDQGDVIGASGGARGAPGAGNSRGPHLHYEVRRNGRAVDPRSGSFATDVANVRDDAADKADAADRRRREEQERILVALQSQLAVRAETARFLGMELRGLEQLSEEERAVADIRRQSADELAKLPEAQRRVTDGLDDQLKAYLAQADQLAGLVTAHGDREGLTAEQRAAEEQVLSAMEAQLTAALALAKTAEDRLRIQEALARVEVRVSRGRNAGEAAERDLERRQEIMDRADREWREEEERRHRDSIERLADFYEDAFNSGGKSIWRQFKDEGKRALAIVAAQYTMALLSGQKVSLGSTLGQMGAVSGAGGGGLGSGFSLLNLFGGASGRGIGSAGAANSVSSVIPMPNADFGSIFKGGMGEGGALGSGAGGGIASGGMSGIGGGLTIGMLGSAAVGSLTGRKNMGSDIGGAIGGIAGSFLPIPGGQIIGSVIGSFIGGIIGKPKAQFGTAMLSNSSSSPNVAWSRGEGFSAAATGAGKSVQDALNGIIEQLGGTPGSFNLSIGQYKDSWRVSTNGYGGKLDFKGVSGLGLKDFGGDQEAAIRFAIQDAINDGAVKGISDASLRLLKAGGDLDAALKKALAIESIPKRLRQMTDPVGFAIDELNKKWAETIAALKEGGASAEQMADAQKLYKLELAETKASARDATEGLKAFLKSIDFGSASPFSLRDQRSKAEAALQPYLASIGKGEAIDTAKFTEAAQEFLELERQLFGSTGAYFQSVDRIRSATGAAISSIDGALPSRGVEIDPFAQATASNTATANELLDQQSSQLQTIGITLQNILRQLGSGGGGGFVGGESRQFVQQD